MTKEQKSGSYDNPLKATVKGIKDLYGSKEGQVVLPEEIDLSGKNIMITGASSGLGFASAEKMARAGGNIIMAIRSGIPEKGDLLKKKTGNQNISMYHVDLSDFHSIDKLLKSLQQDNISLDILVSNAAVVPLSSRKTPQGLEEMFMVNFLSAFYLVNNLLEEKILKDSSRIIIVSSESHRNTNDFEWTTFGDYEEYKANKSVSKYGYTKLLLTTFARELARKLEKEGKDQHIYSLCPGPVNSNIAREAPNWMKPLLKIAFSAFFKSPEKACEPLIYFATKPSDKNYDLEYLFRMQKRDISDAATDPKNGAKLWLKSEELINRLHTKK